MGQLPPPPIGADEIPAGTLTVLEAQPMLAQSTINSIILHGDLSKLSETELAAYYIHRCRLIGLDPATKPFDLLRLNGKLVLYANKSCAANLRALNKISTMILEEREWNGLLLVRVRAWYPDNRQHEDEGYASLNNLSGDALGNARLKAITKATRRAILHLAGLGELDESEVESIPNAKKSAIQEAKLAIQPSNSGKETIQVSDLRVILNGMEVLDSNGNTWPVYDPDAIGNLMTVCAQKIDISIEWAEKDGRHVIIRAQIP